jgi:pimeloyl-ACP methyl ester carboxylesterase
MTRAPEPAPFPLPAAFPPTDTLFFPARLNASTAPLLLFLPGNPGLINYYLPFLRTLSTLHPGLTILGASHAGFTPAPHRLNTAWAWKWGPGPWGLKQQVEMKKELLTHTLEELGGGKRKVVLAAHSMGAWVAMEMVAGMRGGEVDIRGGLMLFPTVMDIAESPQGRLMAPVLRSAPMVKAAQAAAWGLGCLPVGVVEGVVRAVTGQPDEMAAVTRTLVTDPRIVGQALTLAAEEMEVIVEDRWEEEVWNVGAVMEEQEGKGEGGMVFVFGQQDRWVAEKTREEIMGLRKGGAKMLVEQRGLPHGFCIHHGEEMAEMCAVWLKEILGEEE